MLNSVDECRIRKKTDCHYAMMPECTFLLENKGFLLHLLQFLYELWNLCYSQRYWNWEPSSDICSQMLHQEQYQTIVTLYIFYWRIKDFCCNFIDVCMDCEIIAAIRDTAWGIQYQIICTLQCMHSSNYTSRKKIQKGSKEIGWTHYTLRCI